MIVEERIYTLRMGRTAEYLELYETLGYPIQRRYLAKLIGYFTTEVGPLNQVIHLWAYPDFEDRIARRTIMAADPEWRSYVERIKPIVLQQENKLLRPTSFSPAIRLWDADPD